MLIEKGDFDVDNIRYRRNKATSIAMEALKEFIYSKEPVLRVTCDTKEDARRIVNSFRSYLVSRGEDVHFTVHINSTKGIVYCVRDD